MDQFLIALESLTSAEWPVSRFSRWGYEILRYFHDLGSALLAIAAAGTNQNAVLRVTAILRPRQNIFPGLWNLLLLSDA